MPTSDWLLNSVTDWLMHGGGVLVPTAQNWVHSITTGMVCYFALMIMYEAATGGHMASARNFFMVWLPTLVTTNAFLHYYNSPMPWVAVSFHQLIPETARYLINLFHMDTMAAVSRAVEGLLGRTTPPTHVLDPGWIPYYAATGSVWLMEGLMFAYSTLSLIALAIGVAVGPLSIAMRIWPPMRHWFRNWLDYMVSWASYGLILAIILNIWAKALIFGLPSIFHAGGIVDAMILCKAFLLINTALWLSCRKAEAFASHLFGHAVGHAAGYPSHLRKVFL